MMQVMMQMTMLVQAMNDDNVHDITSLFSNKSHKE